MGTIARLKQGIKNKVVYHPKCKYTSGIERIGSDYGGFFVYTRGLSRNPLVYSFGVGEDCSFDREMIEKFDADIYAYDPTPKSIKWVEAQDFPANFHFFPFGIDKIDGEAQFHLPLNNDYVSGSKVMYSGVKESTITVKMKTIPTIMRELRHDNIELLKMDIEGTEFDVIPSVLDEYGGGV